MHKINFSNKINLKKEVNRQALYNGFISSSNFPRLIDTVLKINSDLSTSIEFSKDEVDNYIINLKIDADVTLMCQRCCEDYVYHIRIEQLYMGKRNNYNFIDPNYEEITPDENGDIDILSLIEDELLLALPIIPMHLQNDCSIKDDTQSFGQIEEKENPFAILNKLKK
ncbi:MAG: YceD family protein [Psittacicella sp.]